MKPTGQPVIRLYVDGGKSGKRTLERQLKEIARTILVACGVTRHKDHHTFHPRLPISARLSLTIASHWTKSIGSRSRTIRCAIFLPARQIEFGSQH